MEQEKMRHEIVTSNPDVDVRFYLSKDEGSYVSPHWHNSLEIVYVIKGKVVLNLPRGVKVTASDIQFFLKKMRLLCFRYHSVFMTNMFRQCICEDFLLICIRGMRLKEQNLNG